MNGARVEPAAEEVLRTVGSPKDGRCVIADASEVTLW